MSKVIVYTGSDGNVHVCTPMPEYLKDYTIEEVQAKDTPEGSIIVDVDDLPNEHNDFFNAWELKDTTVTVNLNKAKAITKDRLRAERVPLLQKLDVDYQRADEAADAAKKAEVAAKKQRLRDITLLADDATTLEELRNIHC